MTSTAMAVLSSLICGRLWSLFGVFRSAASVGTAAELFLTAPVLAVVAVVVLTLVAAVVATVVAVAVVATVVATVIAVVATVVASVVAVFLLTVIAAISLIAVEFDASWRRRW